MTKKMTAHNRQIFNKKAYVTIKNFLKNNILIERSRALVRQEDKKEGSYDKPAARRAACYIRVFILVKTLWEYPD